MEGIYPVLVTTFDDAGELDLSSQKNLVNYLLEEGAHGLTLFGNAGEGYALASEERLKILKLVSAEVNGKVPIIVSTGHTGTRIAAQLSKQAQDHGASAVLVLPPYYLRPDADGLIFYYQEISRQVQIPIMVQDAPHMTQVQISPALLARMAEEIEHVRYVKVEARPTSQKVSAVVTATGGKVTVFGGLNGEFMIEEIERGSRGVMPGSDLTASLVRTWDHLRRGDRASAWREFEHALPLIRFELQPGLGVSAMKHNLYARGVIQSTRVRHPTRSLDATSLRELEVLRKRPQCD